MFTRISASGSPPDATRRGGAAVDAGMEVIAGIVAPKRAPPVKGCELTAAPKRGLGGEAPKDGGPPNKGAPPKPPPPPPPPNTLGASLVVKDCAPSMANLEYSSIEYSAANLFVHGGARGKAKRSTENGRTLGKGALATQISAGQRVSAECRVTRVTCDPWERRAPSSPRTVKFSLRNESQEGRRDFWR